MTDPQSALRFKHPVVVDRVIGAPVRQVWELISAPGNLELVHPFCKRNPVKRWPGPTSRDQVHYLSGWLYERRFVGWQDGSGYDLEIGRPGGASSFVSWRITALDNASCKLEIAVYPQLPQRWLAPLRWIPYAFYLRPMLRKYLNSVVGGVQWYIEHGEPVPRNQFGRHPWFSA